MEPKHTQVKVTRQHSFTSWEEEVDEGIVELITSLWNLGIDTMMSCEGDDTMWIDFTTKEDFIIFIEEFDFDRLEVSGLSIRPQRKTTVLTRVGFWFPKTDYVKLLRKVGRIKERLRGKS